MATAEKTATLELRKHGSVIFSMAVHDQFKDGLARIDQYKDQRVVPDAESLRWELDRVEHLRNIAAQFPHGDGPAEVRGEPGALASVVLRYMRVFNERVADEVEEVRVDVASLAHSVETMDWCIAALRKLQRCGAKLEDLPTLRAIERKRQQEQQSEAVAA